MAAGPEGRKRGPCPAIGWAFSAVGLAALPGCGPAGDGFLAAAGPVAEAQREHFLSIAAWMLVVILPLLIALPVVLWRYRLRHGSGRYAPDWAADRTLELLIWGVPVVVVAVLGWNLWRGTLALDPYRPVAGQGAPLEVRVVAMDWKFLFIYPEQGIATVDELRLPLGRPVRFRLTSQTAMQSFIVPRLGGQIYAMAGMVTEINLRADRAGEFTGLNAQYNGRGFAAQKFRVVSLPPDRFADWVADTRSGGGRLDWPRYMDLASPAIEPEALRFGSVEKGLFDRVVRQFARDARVVAAKP